MRCTLLGIVLDLALYQAVICVPLCQCLADTKTVTACTNCTIALSIYQFPSLLAVFGSYISHAPSK